MSKLIRHEYIKIIEKKLSQEELLTHVCQKLEANGIVTSGYLEELMEREIEFPTGIVTKYMNIAIPHTNSKKVLDTLIVVSKLEHPIMWGNMEDLESKIPVQIVFNLILKEESKHMEVLQQIIALIQSEVMQQIQQATSTEEIVKLLEKRIL